MRPTHAGICIMARINDPRVNTLRRDDNIASFFPGIKFAKFECGRKNKVYVYIKLRQILQSAIWLQMYKLILIPRQPDSPFL